MAREPVLPSPFADRYIVEQPIGTGGMSQVYRVYDRVRKERVALKVLHPHLAKDRLQVRRFAEEAALTQRVSHPAVVTVHDSGEDLATGLHYITMELVEGKSLADLMYAGALHRLETLQLLAQVLEPLAEAHRTGIVHRDLKPDNILVEKRAGRHIARLVDFGIARQLGGRGMTRTGIGMGTVHYMSPEQARSAKSAGPPSDLWSVGVMIYETVTGQLPFDGESAGNVVVKIATEEPADPRTFRPELDPRLEAIIQNCLEREPSLRPASAEELRRRLVEVLDDPAVSQALVGEVCVAATFEMASEPGFSMPSPIPFQHEAEGTPWSVVPRTSARSDPPPDLPVPAVEASPSVLLPRASQTSASSDAPARGRWLSYGLAATGAIALGSAVALLWSQPSESAEEPPRLAPEAPTPVGEVAPITPATFESMAPVMVSVEPEPSPAPVVDRRPPRPTSRPRRAVRRVPMMAVPYAVEQESPAEEPAEPSPPPVETPAQTTATPPQTTAAAPPPAMSPPPAPTMRTVSTPSRALGAPRPHPRPRSPMAPRPAAPRPEPDRPPVVTF
ncbi:MAG: serine/threonine-protein kinase [Myxococcota bacterium]